jgi:hypothetical protein
VWIETTGAMIEAMETIIDATQERDTERARLAAEEIGALQAEAATADRALRIAVSEGGNAVGAPALGRLATILDAIETAHARLGAVRSGAAR